MYRDVVCVIFLLKFYFKVIPSCDPLVENINKTIRVKLNKTGILEKNTFFWKQNSKKLINCFDEGVCTVTPGEIVSAQATLINHQNYLEVNLTFPDVSRSLHGTRWTLWDVVDDIMLYDCNLTTYVQPIRPDCSVNDEKILICSTEKVYPVLMCEFIYNWNTTYEFSQDRVQYDHTSYVDKVEYFRSECRVNVSEEIQSNVTTFHVKLYPNITGEKTDAAYGVNTTVTVSHNKNGLRTRMIVSISAVIAIVCTFLLVWIFKFKCQQIQCNVHEPIYYEVDVCDIYNHGKTVAEEKPALPARQSIKARNNYSDKEVTHSSVSDLNEDLQPQVHQNT